MKIAITSPGYPPARGGVETVVAQSARALVRAGHHVEVLTDDPQQSVSVVDDDAGVVVRRFSCSRGGTYRMAPALWRYLRGHAHEFDVVHAHSYHAPTAALTGATLARSASATPLVISPHYHGTGHTAVRSLLHRAWRPIGALALARAQVVVCVSGAERRLLSAHFPELADRTAVVPNGVDTVAIGSAEPFTDQPPTVLGVGRLEHYKRVDLLITAFAETTRRAGRLRGAANPAARAQLVIIGEGPERAGLMRLATQHGVAERTRWLTGLSTSEVHRWLRTASVLCSLSEREAFGLVPAEALVAGTPVVLSAIPAHRELAEASPGRAVELVDGTRPDRTAELLDRALAPASAPDRTPSLGAGVRDWGEVGVLLARTLSGATTSTPSSIST